ncbi:cytochrome c3 family protein [Pendulispora albinea]|uniref:Cytochrome c7-like domain-containing protein n=1 Tax=Pendulispora albinea TaxID=2741071 RepID=A0ABZ2LQT3_9BACT
MKTTSFLAGSMALAVWIAACGGAQPTPEQPPGTSGPGPNPDVNAPSPSGSSSTAPATSAPPAGSTAPAGSATPTVVAPMKPIATSAMAIELQNIGLDLKNLPPLEKLEPAKVRKVMRTFNKALGAKCSDCHNEADYSAMTPKKKIALHMWNDYVRGLALEDGTALYCDSCHQGRMEFLDRRDKKALAAWMEQNYEDKMRRRDGKEHKCATCHGDPFDGAILARWAK